MKTIKIFLASSSKLKEYREKLTVSIAAKNKILNSKNINLELVIWEDLSEAMQLTRLYNQKPLKKQSIIKL